MDSVDVEYERLAQVGEGTYGYFSQCPWNIPLIL